MNGTAAPPAGEAPSIARRLASMVYESLLLFAVAFAGTWAFFFASGGQQVDGWLRHLLQLQLVVLLAGYFIWCWSRGGQTLAMKAWHIRLIAPGYASVPPRLALVRFVYATFTVGGFMLAVAAAFARHNIWLSFASLAVCGIGLGWALVDRDRQFLHDRLAGTRLVRST